MLTYLKPVMILTLAASVALVVGCGDSGGGGNGGNGMGGDSGTGGSGGDAGTGGDSGTGGTGGGVTPGTKAISLGCSNSVTPAIAILDWELGVEPEGDIVGGESFTAEFGGSAFFSEAFLDIALSVIPGLKTAQLLGLSATVAPRSGATGESVVLGPGPTDSRCELDDPIGSDNFPSCDLTNAVSGNPDDQSEGNTDCTAINGEPSEFDPCVTGFVDFPITEDEGECDALGKADQFTVNGFCITGALRLPLEPESAEFVADEEGEVLFGWDDMNTPGVTLREDGTYDIPLAVVGNPTEPNGLRVLAGALAVGLQCVMAVDSNGPDGVGVPDQSSPTPDELLFSLPIETAP